MFSRQIALRIAFGEPKGGQGGGGGGGGEGAE